VLVAPILFGVGDAFADVSPALCVGLRGVIFAWPAYTNRDALGADTGAGFALAVVGGLDLESASAKDISSLPPPRLLEGFSDRLEREVDQRFAGIHGINDGSLQRTGDGKALRATIVEFDL